mmetsp:Transcript_93678/g.293016  ORF Transcript_93678/g.293016 Transcript_93678/m.293016 type:complete len:200 (-) Transcript_93678:55-654(-)
MIFPSFWVSSRSTRSSSGPGMGGFCTWRLPKAPRAEGPTGDSASTTQSSRRTSGQLASDSLRSSACSRRRSQGSRTRSCCGTTTPCSGPSCSTWRIPLALGELPCTGTITGSPGTVARGGATGRFGGWPWRWLRASCSPPSWRKAAGHPERRPSRTSRAATTCCAWTALRSPVAPGSRRRYSPSIPCLCRRVLCRCAGT